MRSGSCPERLDKMMGLLLLDPRLQPRKNDLPFSSLLVMALHFRKTCFMIWIYRLVRTRVSWRAASAAPPVIVAWLSIAYKPSYQVVTAMRMTGFQYSGGIN